MNGYVLSDFNNQINEFSFVVSNSSIVLVIQKNSLFSFLCLLSGGGFITNGNFLDVLFTFTMMIIYFNLKKKSKRENPR